jgi:hypothetical protein
MAHLNNVRGPNQIEDLSFYLQIALTDYVYEYDSFVYTQLSFSIVEALLQYGATLDGNNLWPYVLGILRKSGHLEQSSDLLMLLLRCGADPFDDQLRVFEKGLDSEVLKLAKIRREEAIRNGRRPKSVWKIVAVENG